jgi:hypothetical protein
MCSVIWRKPSNFDLKSKSNKRKTSVGEKKKMIKSIRMLMGQQKARY